MDWGLNSELVLVFVSYVLFGKSGACFNTCLCPSLGDNAAVLAAVGAWCCFALNSCKWHGRSIPLKTYTEHCLPQPAG